MTEGIIELSKIDATRHQLETSIELFFENKDPVSIHTLLMSAWGILKDLPKKVDDETSREMFFSEFPQFSGKQIMETLHKSWNFFKHAERDPGARLHFDYREDHTLLFFVTIDYSLHAELTITMQILQLWFIHFFGDKFPQDDGSKLHVFSKMIMDNFTPAGQTVSKLSALNAIRNQKEYLKVAERFANELVDESSQKGQNTSDRLF